MRNLNWLERAIGFVSPSIALKRQQAILHTEHLRSYDAASRGRRTESWKATGTSSNTEILTAATTLRNRSRDLSRNNPFAKKAVQSISNNTIGTGIRAKVSANSKGAKKRLHDAWIGWADKTACDNEGRKTYYGIQKMVMRAVIESGDCLILKRIDKDAKIPLKLIVLEIDHLDMNKNDASADKDGNFNFLGIRFNKKGQRIGYWLFDSHPGEYRSFTNLTSKLVPANSVIHVFEQLRPAQQLGVPFGVSSFLRARDMDEYNDAQVIRQKIAACYSVFIQTDASIGTAVERAEMERVEPGIIQQLGAGETVSFGQPPTVENFAEFHRTIMQGIGAGFGTTYENITGDYSNVNFSSGKMGHIEHHRNVEDWQWNMIIPQLNDPIWEWFIEAADLAGVSTAGAGAEWTPPRREMIDQAKEVKGILGAVRMGLMSVQDAIREQGYDPEEVIEEMAEWNKILDEKGIILDSDPRQGKGMPPDGRGRPADTGGKIGSGVDEGK
jgi:lambda family phage portal protein